MKTILLATDFSASANDAVRYGYDLACRIRAKVILINAMVLAAEVPQSGFVTWPDAEFDGLLEDYTQELKNLQKELESGLALDAYRPPLQCINEVGRFTQVITEAVKNYRADLMVIGTHQGGLFSRLLVGNHAEQLMDAATSPLLIIKPGTAFKNIKKIAYATEFSQPEKDLENIFNLIPLAKLLNAEILLAHVSTANEDQEKLHQTMAEYLVELSNRADYPNIYYRLIPNAKTEAGLTWLCEHGQVDMLAMAHRLRNVLAEYFGHSHTKNMHKLLDLPLLVIPMSNN